jgi:hypothetical protein
MNKKWNYYSLNITKLQSCTKMKWTLKIEFVILTVNYWKKCVRQNWDLGTCESILNWEKYFAGDQASTIVSLMSSLLWYVMCCPVAVTFT